MATPDLSSYSDQELAFALLKLPLPRLKAILTFAMARLDAQARLALAAAAMAAPRAAGETVGRAVGQGVEQAVKGLFAGGKKNG